jgi:hypothetical protein
MMRRPVGVPVVKELSCPNGESIPAICIADLQDGTCNGFRLSHQKFERAVDGLDDRKKGNRAIADGHFDGEATARFSVVKL